ncbi:MAG: NAD-dependent succinate-semialdehyde dehydrogenase [Enterobacterales bacterium]|nr:NAD-dependent succinate-semialdehyde dehydrogenase [Enterobacterales bacterium]
MVNGEWQTSDQSFAVVNPANEVAICQVAEVTVHQLEQAILSADASLAVWQQLGDAARSQCLIDWQQLMRDNLQDLARLITLEQGKPLSEAKGEIIHAANYVKLYAQLAQDCRQAISIPASEGQTAQVLRQPIGVVTAITPWNFPCAMVLRKAAAAMAAGCSVVLKPSELTPLTAMAIAHLSIQAGIPKGVFNLVVGSNAQAIGEILTQHPKVAKFSFTGSTQVGRKLLQQCAFGIKRSSMELGGNAPFIVCEDANLEQAIKGAMIAKFRNAGQTCVSANRFLLHESIADAFIRGLTQAIEQLIIGDGQNETSQIGPLINQAALDKTTDLIQQSLSLGATLIVGGKAMSGKGFFFAPSLVDKVTAQMPLFQREIFGPVVAITRFSSDQEMITLANQSEKGLCGYLYSQDQKRIQQATQQIEVGLLGINVPRLSNIHAPFGGIKQSGMGREGGHYGIEEYLTYQYVCQQNGG